MNLKRNYIWLLPLLAIVTSPGWWGVAGRLLGPRTSTTREAPPVERQLNTFVLHQVTLNQSRNGVDDLFVKAIQVNSGRVADELEMLGVEGVMTGTERSVNFSGGTARYEPTGQVLSVGERVKLETSDGYRLETASLRCLTATRQVESEQVLNMTSSGLRLRGKGCLYS
ncbi:MAG TPA: hypothetical protein VLA15_09675, partial [Desulfurivibrionaceae bacterium]|nr:hypothetical protein [Desulfurivibrionaceae bacterium]